MKQTVKLPVFEPDEWEGKVANCYIYARDYLGADDDNIFDLGDIYAAKQDLYDSDSFPDRAQVKAGSIAEVAVNEGLIWEGTTLPKQAKDGCYLVCLLLSSVDKGGEWHEHEHHWRRQDADGKWSEKLGENAPQEVKDPESLTKDYDVFYGYFSCPVWKE